MSNNSTIKKLSLFRHVNIKHIKLITVKLFKQNINDKRNVQLSIYYKITNPEKVI